CLEVRVERFSSRIRQPTSSVNSYRTPGTAVRFFPVEHPAEKKRTAVPELRYESTELVACVCLSDRCCAVGQCVSCKYRCPLVGIERVEVESQLCHQRIVEKQQSCCAHDCRLLRNEESFEFASEGIVEAECSDRAFRFVCCSHSQVCHTANREYRCQLVANKTT